MVYGVVLHVSDVAVYGRVRAVLPTPDGRFVRRTTAHGFRMSVRGLADEAKRHVPVGRPQDTAIEQAPNLMQRIAPERPRAACSPGSCVTGAGWTQGRPNRRRRVVPLQIGRAS